MASDTINELFDVIDYLYSFGFVPIPLKNLKPYKPNWQKIDHRFCQTICKKELRNKNANGIGILVGNFNPFGETVKTPYFIISCVNIEAVKIFTKLYTIPQTLIVERETKGRDYYFLMPSEYREFKSFTHGGITFKTHGSYNTAPGMMVDGFIYSSFDNNMDLSMPPKNLIEWIVNWQ